MAGHEAVERRRVAEGERAHERAIDAGRQHLVDRGLVAEAAAELQHAPVGPLGQQALDDRAVGGWPLAGARGVEVDHVQGAGAGGPELASQGGGVVAVRRLGVEAALHQAHHAAAGEVERGNDVERGHRISMLTCCT